MEFELLVARGAQGVHAQAINIFVWYKYSLTFLTVVDSKESFQHQWRLSKIMRYAAETWKHSNSFPVFSHLFAAGKRFLGVLDNL